MTAELTFAFVPNEVYGTIMVDGKPQVHRLIERTVVHGDPPEGFTRFAVTVQRPTGLAGPNGQQLVDAAELSLLAGTLSEAFESLPEVLKEWTDQSKKNVAMALLSAPPPSGFDPYIKNKANGFKPRLSLD